MNAQELHVFLPPIPPSISVARRIVRDAAGDLPANVVGDAELLTSELVTNAIRYGGASIELSAERADDTLTVAVRDDGGELPSTTQASPAPEAVSGRGLRIVEQVACAWGIRTEEDSPGKTVWFRVAVGESGAQETSAGDGEPGTSK